MGRDNGDFGEQSFKLVKLLVRQPREVPNVTVAIILRVAAETKPHAKRTNVNMAADQFETLEPPVNAAERNVLLDVVVSLDELREDP